MGRRAESRLLIYNGSPEPRPRPTPLPILQQQKKKKKKAVVILFDFINICAAAAADLSPGKMMEVGPPKSSLMRKLAIRSATSRHEEQMKVASLRARLHGTSFVSRFPIASVPPSGLKRPSSWPAASEERGPLGGSSAGPPAVAALAAGPAPGWPFRGSAPTFAPAPPYAWQMEHPSHTAAQRSRVAKAQRESDIRALADWLFKKLFPIEVAGFTRLAAERVHQEALAHAMPRKSMEDEILEAYDSDVDWAMNSKLDPEEMLVENCAKQQLRRRDFCTLRPGTWLNDEMINGFCSFLSRTHPDNDCMFLNTFFLVALTRGGEYNYDNVKSWTRQLGKKTFRPEKNLVFDFRLIVAPLNELQRAHWTLAVIDLELQEFRYYDSLGARKPPSLLKSLQQWLRDEYRAKASHLTQFGSIETWPIRVVSPCPQQSNGVDCGAFSCAFAATVGRPGHDLMKEVSQRDMSMWRRKIAACLLSERDNCAKLRDRRGGLPMILKSGPGIPRDKAMHDTDSRQQPMDLS